MIPQIRAEAVGDQGAIRLVHEQAFGRSVEADAIDALRQRQQITLSLLAIENGQVVGHILFSPVTIETQFGQFPALGLAPLAVLPSYQKRGVGSALVERGLELCRHLPVDCIVVLGDPHYYQRFGFVPAYRYQLHCPWDVPPEVFMVHAWQEGVLENRAGLARYQPEWDGV